MKPPKAFKQIEKIIPPLRFWIVIPALAFILLCWYYHFTQDDAFITFRYVENFLSGHGLVWNIGERVEGYTNFLWLILQILLAKIGFDYTQAIKLCAIALSLGTLVLTYKILRLRFEQTGTQVLIFFTVTLVALNYSFIYWTIAGLETPLFAFLVLASFLLYRNRSWALAPLLTLAILTRPEGILLAGFYPLFSYIQQRKLPKSELKLIGITAILLLPYLAFKLVFYGSLAPNTFYAKTVWDFDQVLAGLNYSWEFLRYYGLFGALLITPAFVYRRMNETIRSLYLFSVLYTIYIVLIGGDVLKVGRFFLPVLAPLYIAFAVSLAHLLKRQALTLAVVIPQLALQMYLPYSSTLQWRGLEQGLVAHTYGVILQLRAVDSSNFTLATSTIGVAGYTLMGHDVYDMIGLTDSTVARRPQEPIEGLSTTWLERKYNAEYILSLAPDYIYFSTGAKPSSPGERALFLYPAFLDNYHTISFRSAIGPKDTHVYKKMNDSLGPIERTIKAGFVQEFHAGLNELASDNYREALDHFQNAREYRPEKPYPYLYFYAGMSLAELGKQDAAFGALQAVVSIDSNVYLAHEVLYRDLYQNEISREMALESRKHIARIFPWALLRLDREAGYRPEK